MTNPAVRIGLVGYGFGGRYFHAPLIASAAGCELAGVVTGSPDRRAEVAQDHPDIAVYGSVNDLLAAGVVDAVAVSTPAATHTQLTETLLHRGVPVICDKPFALDAVAARHTVELAEREGVLLSPYQNRRWDSDLLTIKALLDADSLGELYRFESAFERCLGGSGASLARVVLLAAEGVANPDLAMRVMVSRPTVDHFQVHHRDLQGAAEESHGVELADQVQQLA